MNADEIRSIANHEDLRVKPANSGSFNSAQRDAERRKWAQVVMLGEIAAQLAELNATLHGMTTSPADGITRQLAVWVDGVNQ